MKKNDQILTQNKERVVLLEPLFLGDDKNVKETELERLCDSANLDTVEIFSQNIKDINPKFVFGEGKVQEVADYVSKNNIDAVVVDFALSPSQTKNLSLAIGSKIVDRIMLIIDIFAQRAKTDEGKIQVKLAQDKYLISRLVTMQNSAGRFGGAGVGMRGPGESKLEVDRRKLEQEIISLSKKIESIKKSRQVSGKSRHANGCKNVAIVGYTNAGKSTFLNALTKENIYVDDRLFATLDTTSRKIWLGDTDYCIITDTVGFISNLPHELVDSFSATLQEAQDADLILHIVDFSDGLSAKKMQVTNKVLDNLGIKSERVLVYNKCDDKGLCGERGGAMYVSAKNGYGLCELKGLLKSKLFGKNG